MQQWDAGNNSEALWVLRLPNLKKQNCYRCGKRQGICEKLGNFLSYTIQLWSGTAKFLTENCGRIRFVIKLETGYLTDKFPLTSKAHQNPNKHKRDLIRQKRNPHVATDMRITFKWQCVEGYMYINYIGLCYWWTKFCNFSTELSTESRIHDSEIKTQNESGRKPTQGVRLVEQIYMISCPYW